MLGREGRRQRKTDALPKESTKAGLPSSDVSPAINVQFCRGYACIAEAVNTLHDQPVFDAMMMPGTYLGRVAMTPTEIKSAVNLRRLLTDNADIIQRITIAPSCSQLIRRIPVSCCCRRRRVIWQPTAVFADKTLS